MCINTRNVSGTQVMHFMTEAVSCIKFDHGLPSAPWAGLWTCLVREWLDQPKSETKEPKDFKF